MPARLKIPRDAPLGYATFPGVVAVQSATYTLSHGITPGVCTMVISPQDPGTLSLGGDLVFVFGQTQIVFPDCKIDLASLRYDDSGAAVTLNIIDRRWKWTGLGTISGQFNQREWDGTILPFHQYTPQQLAARCLDAMGEVNYDVTQLPNLTFPATTWNVIVPSQALADLCESLGCRVVLKLDGTVQICLPGIGTPLPLGSNTPIYNFGQTVNPPERPDSLIVICSRDRFQVDLPLEPVVLDLTGWYVPYRQASYTPPGGWAGVIPGRCDQIVGAPFGRAHELAVNTFCRAYRIMAKNLDGSSPLQLPGYGPVLDYRQMLPITGQQVQKFLDIDGSIIPYPAWLYGIFCGGQVNGALVNTPLVFGDTPQTLFWRGFSLDLAHGIVNTNGFAYAVESGTGVVTPATLYLRTSVNVNSFDAWTPSRYQRQKVYPVGFGTMPRYLQHDEMEYQALPSYDPTGKVERVLDNSPEINLEADFYLATADLQYQVVNSGEVCYRGLLPISTDGLIQQVTWTVGTSEGASTKAGQNNEYSTVVPPYRLRRQFEQQRANFFNQVRQAVAAQAQQGLVPGRKGL